MSWHCFFCGGSDEVTGLLEIFDIRGGVPPRLSCHIKCVAKVLGRYDSELKTELLDLEKENAK